MIGIRDDDFVVDKDDETTLYVDALEEAAQNVLESIKQIREKGDAQAIANLYTGLVMTNIMTQIGIKKRMLDAKLFLIATDRAYEMMLAPQEKH